MFAKTIPKVRHLHFTQSLETLYGGGLGSSASGLHRQMLSMQIESTLCATHGGTLHSGTPDRTYEFRRVRPDFLYYSPQLRRRGRDLVTSTDVLHGHGLYVGTNYIFGTEARRQRKPMVYHVQGMFEPYILRRSRWKKRLVHWLFEDENFRNVRLWRALTSREADQIRSCGLTAPIVVAPNGLNTAEYSRPANLPPLIDTPLVPHLSKERRRLLFLSRIHPKKGLDLLVPSWARVVAATRNDWELVIAGPDEQGYLAVIRDLAKQFGIIDKIIFTGTVTGSAKTALLYSADLFVLPSYSEGLPVSLLEAMACEVPVVASLECNCPAIGPAGAGWLCDLSIGSLVKALSAAMRATEGECKQRGANGRRLVEDAYSWPKIAAEIVRACAEHCS